LSFNSWSLYCLLFFALHLQFQITPYLQTFFLLNIIK
jgi:hypothetical protein